MNYALIVLCVSLVYVKAWRHKMQKSTWEVNLVRRAVDTHITMETQEALTPAGCGFICSHIFGVAALSLYFIKDTHTCYCNDAIDNTPEDVDEAILYYGTLNTLYMKEETTEETAKLTVWPYHTDCFSLYNADYREDGVYILHLVNNIVAWCDMTDGGWTVIQRRTDGSRDFYRSWEDYVYGFNGRDSEFWIGLRHIHSLTQTGSQLEIFLEAFPGVSPPSMTAHYSHFKVESSDFNYALNISGFTGDCGDSMAFHNGQQFTTFDKDNDKHQGLNCAVTHGGAWWYKSCHNSNLNGIYYQNGEYVFDGIHANGIIWYTCWGHEISLKTSVIKIRPQ